MTTVTISLPESLKAFVESQLAEKGYGNVSEYFRSLLREAQVKEQDARLTAAFARGWRPRSSRSSTNTKIAHPREAVQEP
jgi:putative addiction module CopG family antidote